MSPYIWLVVMAVWYVGGQYLLIRVRRADAAQREAVRPSDTPTCNPIQQEERK